ncbi:MAG: hypothetical protein J0M02_00215 [Planctomycetes bacterium]|nr:hypothetical protein [Planctomycetota bacterium]
MSGTTRAFAFGAIAFLMLVVASAGAAVPRDHAIAITATVQVDPPRITLAWPTIAGAGSIILFRKAPDSSSWGPLLANLPGSATSYVDAGVVVGQRYEYHIAATQNGVNAVGFVLAGIEIPLVEDRGRVLLVVDQTLQSALASEISRLRRDLVGDGWSVDTVPVRRQSTTATAGTALEVAAVKQAVDAAHQAAGRPLRAVLLLGRVPVPYAGLTAPDGHTNHLGAWPADVYYGAAGQEWTDHAVDAAGSSSRQSNRPGDGRLDPTWLETDSIAVAVGRVDFSAMPAFTGLTETDLLRRYLDKNHAFRHRARSYARRCVIDDNFGEPEPEARSGWLLASVVGSGHVVAGDIMGDATYSLWSYGSGGGTNTSASGVGTTANYVANSPRAVFTMLFGSWFGDYDQSNNLMRASLASPGSALTCVWGGRPQWLFHRMSLGEPIADSIVLSQGRLPYYLGQSAGIHSNLLGDPTLRMYILAPPGDLSAEDGNLVWTASADAAIDGFAGYHVYRANSADGPFERLTASPITATSWTDPTPPSRAAYQVRAVALTTTPGGTFLNCSQGAHAEFGFDVPAATISFRYGSAAFSEDGGSATVVVERTGSVAAAASVVYSTIFGSATAADFTHVGGVLSWDAADAGSRTITVPLSADTTDEPNERFTVVLSDPMGGSIPAPVSTVCIVDDDALPTVSIACDQTSIDEAGGFATFTISLSAASSRDVSISAAFWPTTGGAIRNTDYASSSTTLIIPAGTASVSVIVTAIQDTLVENDEEILLIVTSATNARSTSPDASVLIVDDDQPVVTLSIAGAVMAESDGVSVVTATLSSVAVRDARIGLEFTGSAALSEDWSRSGVSVLIPAGSISASITLAAIDDVVDEEDETIIVDIGSTLNAVESSVQRVVATVSDDDPPPILAIADAAVVEGDDGSTTCVFAVAVSGASDRPASCDWVATALSATAGVDFIVAGGTLTIPAGEAVGEVAVVVSGDREVEGDETFQVILSAPHGATLDDASGTGTIIDDDVSGGGSSSGDGGGGAGAGGGGGCGAGALAGLLLVLTSLLHRRVRPTGDGGSHPRIGPGSRLTTDRLHPGPCPGAAAPAGGCDGHRIRAGGKGWEGVWGPGGWRGRR